MAQQDTARPVASGGSAAGHREVAARTQLLLDAVRDVTLEEFHSEDAHFERHSRLGRELLYLVANDTWCRRTTEVVDVSHAQEVDTDVIVDVDLSYADHEAFELDAGLTWLPLLALPPMRPLEDDDPPRRWPGLRRPHRADLSHEDPDPVASLEVSDAAGARVHKLPQAEVHQRLAAALAELILNVLASRSQLADAGPGTDLGPAMERQQKLLLSAAIRRLLPGAGGQSTGRGGTVPAGVREARIGLDGVLSRDIELSEQAADRAGSAPGPPATLAQGLDPYDDSVPTEDDEPDQNSSGLGNGPGLGDGPGLGNNSGLVSSSGRQNNPGTRTRPVLGSHVGEILDALIGTTFVVVAVEDPGHPISYTIHVPSRRLIRIGRTSMWFQPRVLLSIDLLAPTAHADRLIRLLLPDGVICHDGSAGVLGRIDVVLPSPFERLDALMARLFPAYLPSDRPASWVDSRLAEMALHKVDTALDSLRHYQVTATRTRRAADPHRRRSLAVRLRRRPADPTGEELTAEVDRRLRRLRDELAAVRRSTSNVVSRAARPAVGGGTVEMSGLWDCWDGGSWFPARMRRRLAVNTASSNLVMMRATAVDDISLRARPTLARIDADVSVFDSPVFNVARYAGALNMTVLAVLTGLLFRRTPTDSNAVELLATILTLFSAVQASRVEHPDGSTLRGLLSKASYWVMLASVLPTVLLAMVLAVLLDGPDVHSNDHRAAWTASVALVAQGLLMLRLRRGPLSRWRRGAPPRVTLSTGHSPDHARVDVLRGRRSRALLTEALLLGREAFAYVVTRPTGQDQFGGLLERTQSGGTRVEERLGRVTARAAKLLAARGVELPRAGPVAAAQVALTGSAAVNLLGVVQSATAGRAMTYLVFRERPAIGWINGDQPEGSTVATVPLDPDRLAPMETPEWVLEVLIGIPESAVAIALADHPLLAIVTATRRYNFRVTAVQLPAPPPPGGAGRRWMQVRVGVSYRRGDSLRGLAAFLNRLHRMDGAPFAGGTLSVIVRVNAEQSVMPARNRSRPLSDRDFDVVPDDEAATDPYRNWRVLAVTAHSRVGLLHDVLTGLADDSPSFALAGLTAAAVYGQTVLFMVGRDPAAPDQDVALRQALPLRVRVGDRLLVAVDQRLTAKALDGEGDGEDRLLLRVGVRTPDRPGVLRETLRTLADVLTEHAPPGVRITGLDVWFVLLQVVNGRTTRGRLTLRLPGSAAYRQQWEAVDWAAVERSLGRAAAPAARAGGSKLGELGWWSPALDDTVITAELLRTVVPAPLIPPT